MALPILTIYKGDAWYLWYSMRQLRLTNPDAPIYLISDRRVPQYEPFVTLVPLGEYMAGAEGFASRYTHLSSMPISYELFCFQRWFVFKEFLARNKLGPAVVVDGDLMAYTNLDAEMPRFAGSELTVTDGKNPQCMFLPQGAEGLERFTSFLTETYTRRLGELEAWYREYKQGDREGGVCDMTLFERYRLLHPERVAAADAIRNGSTFDNNVRRADGYQMARGYKRFTWIDGRPHGRHLESGELVRFNSLHFQGGAKLLMPYFAYRRDGSFFRRLLLETPPRRTARGLLLLAGR